MAGITAFVLLGAAQSTPLLLAGLGGLVSEAGGIINFALEAMMLAGAFTAVWVTHATGSPWMGLLGGAAAGAMTGLLHAIACVTLRANQIVSSIALNLLASGLTGSLLNQVFRVYGTSPAVSKLPTLGQLGWRLGPGDSMVAGGLGGMSVLVPCSFVVAMLVWILIVRTPWGLALRACGENPFAAASSGLRVSGIRIGAVTLGGVFAGVGGAYLSIGELAHFVERMTQGRGYLAVAALILGRWRPGGVLAVAVLFGFAEALSQWLAVRWPQWPPQLFLALPYVLGLAVLFFRWDRQGSPSALGAR
jgi:general nucleoside transport system permease protein